MNKPNLSSKIFKTIKESLNGEQFDYTQGSIPKAVIYLAIPMILELSLESVFALVDIFFVSKLGKNAITTVGLTESVLTLVYSCAIGLSTAATAIVARRIGEKNPDEAAKAGAQTILVAFGLIVIISVLGFVFAGNILQLMGAQPDVIVEGQVFTRIIFGSSFAIVLLFLINGIFRGAGDAVMAMRSLWIASIINIILCPILIHFFGLKGAAIATVIGRSSGVLYQTYNLFRKGNILQFHRTYFKSDFTIIKSIIGIAWPATFQFLIASGSWIIIARLVAETGGTTASAGCQIAIRNFVFFILPAWGLCNAAATLVGQNLGANQPDRAEKSVLLVARYNIIFMGCVSAFFVFFPTFIIGFFTPDVEIIDFGAKALRIFGYGYVFYGIEMVMIQSLNGAGDTKTPTYINIVGFWLFQVPLAFTLAKILEWNALGAIMAVPIAEAFIAYIAWYYFKKGDWKNVKI